MASIESSLLLGMLAGQKLRFTHLWPVALQRLQLEQAAWFARMPAGIEAARVTVAGMRAEWVGSPEVPGGRAILYLHGGAYCIGSCSTHRALVARIARAAGMCALTFEYRLAPEHPFPAALDDTLAAYQWMLAQGYQANQIILIGDSAGGGLALALMLALRDRGLPLPAAAALCSPWADLAGEGDSMRTHARRDPLLTPDMLRMGSVYYGNYDPHHPLISPVYADLHGLPPLFIQVGDHEILLSDATRLAERARQAGVPVDLQIWERMWHGWHFFAPTLPEANQAIVELGAFARYILMHTIG